MGNTFALWAGGVDPLTVTDHATRYLLLCEALDSTREDPAIAAFEHLFRERGLPVAIRSHNGVPFSSPNALFGCVSAWKKDPEGGVSIGVQKGL